MKGVEKQQKYLIRMMNNKKTLIYKISKETCRSQKYARKCSCNSDRIRFSDLVSLPGPVVSEALEEPAKRAGALKEELVQAITDLERKRKEGTINARFSNEKLCTVLLELTI